MRKRLFSLALALAMCLGLTAVPASAASATLTEIVSSDAVQSFIGGNGRIDALNFSDGVAWIEKTAIDTTGKVLIKSADYKWVGDFSEGVAWAQRDGTTCAIDKNGQVLFDVKYTDSNYLHKDSIFQEGLCKVFSNSEGGYFYVDKSGKLAIPSGNAAQDGGAFCEGLAVCYDRAAAYYGYMDKTGKVVIPCQYSNARDFTDGVAAVQLGNRWTIIDKTGKDLLPQDYSLTSGYSGYSNYISPQVVAAKGPGSSEVFINRAGQVVSGGYYSVRSFVDGMAQVATNSSEYGFVNEAGVLVIPCDYRRVYDFRDGFTAASRESGSTASYDILDKTGKVVGTTNGVSLNSNAGNGCFSTQLNEGSKTRYGFVDYTGKQIVPCKYAEVKDFSSGVAAVKTFDYKWGFVDTNGTEIVPCKYHDIIYSNEPGIFAVNDSGRWSIWKSSGWTAPATPSTPTTPTEPTGLSATPTTSTVLVNGEQVAFDAYNIDGSNYFKLRDLAYALNGSEKQFDVVWNASANAISLTSGKSYTAAGGELAPGSGAVQEALPTTSALLLDGADLALEAYNINGNNYFKLRDLGSALNFGVDWDGAANTVVIDTAKGYTP